MFGEAVGNVEPTGRTAVFSWVGCGSMPTAWGFRRHDTNDDDEVNELDAMPGWFQFSSNHDGIVNFSLADGAVLALSTEVDERIYASLGEDYERVSRFDALGGARDQLQAAID